MLPLALAIATTISPADASELEIVARVATYSPGSMVEGLPCLAWLARTARLGFESSLTPLISNSLLVSCSMC